MVNSGEGMEMDFPIDPALLEEEEGMADAEGEIDGEYLSEAVSPPLTHLVRSGSILRIPIPPIWKFRSPLLDVVDHPRTLSLLRPNITLRTTIPNQLSRRNVIQSSRSS
jgi:hypothetical protein